MVAAFSAGCDGVRRQEVEIDDEPQEIPDFGGRPQRDLQEPLVVPNARSTAALDDIGRNRRRGAPQLGREAEPLSGRSPRCEPVDIDGQLVGELEDVQARGITSHAA
jgi:hypothetical protein